MHAFLVIFLISYANSQVFDGKINDPCESTIPEEDVSGVCVEPKSCKIFQAQRNRLRICSFNNREPIVCCPFNQINIEKRKSDRKCEEYLKMKKSSTSTRSEPLTLSNLLKNIKDRFKRQHFQTNVVGGTKTTQNEYPFMTAIGIQEKRKTNWYCGGSLISENFVLTAAHCVNQIENRNSIVIRVGDKNLDSNNDNVKPQQFSLSDTFVHPNYDENLKYHDVALIKLKTRATFNQHVHPACLSTKIAIDDKKAEVLGWGSTSFGGASSSELLKATLDIVPNSKCQISYRNDDDDLPQGITSNQICAGDETKTRDTCQNDSGGPLQLKRYSNSSSYFEIIGITSFGKFCAAGTPGVYTKVSAYLDWIESIVWP